jgi:(1->4)-alpha-D-glucan 1-alpha-D-glucosylmutase
MFVMACALRLRRRESALFIEGAYDPLRAEGAEASRVVAFARTLGDKTLIAAVPRVMNQRLPDGHRIPLGSAVWKDTRLFVPGSSQAYTFRHVLTGARLKPADDGSMLAADVFRACPVALLITESHTHD